MNGSGARTRIVPNTLFKVIPETGKLKGFCYIGILDDGSQAIGYSQGDCSVDELLDACATLQDQIEQIARSE